MDDPVWDAAVFCKNWQHGWRQQNYDFMEMLNNVTRRESHEELILTGRHLTIKEGSAS
jgi:hypothetical protein